MIQINGKQHENLEGKSVLSVIEALGFKPERVAIELNGDIVRRASFSDVTIADGDKIEIVHFVGGG